MSRLYNFLICSILVAAVISCSGNSNANPNLPPNENPTDYKFASSDLHRENHPNVPQSDQNALVAGNTGFAFDLYSELSSNDGNIFFSPFSISQAMAMTYSGARGNTETEIADTMRFNLPQEKLHPAWNWLDLELHSRAETPTSATGDPFRLSIANSTWGQDGYVWLDPFLDTLAVNYGAGMRILDFIMDPDNSRLIINRWVEDRTENKIKNLLQPGVIDSDTRMVLVNAIYFNASWLEPFEPDITEPRNFYLLDNSSASVPMMSQTEDHGYSEGNGWKAVELKYDGEELSMVIILPDTGRFAEIEGAMTSEWIDDLVDSMGEYSVTLTMPKWEFESQFGLADTLKSMGIVDAFNPGVADLSGMDGSMNLFISDIVHKAFVSVDEEGTEAAAATAVVIGFTSMPMPAELNANRPFIFFIRDIPTGSILFLGRVLDPR